MSADRKSTNLERRAKFLIQSFSYDDTEQLDSQVESIESILQQLSKQNEDLESGTEEHKQHKQQHFQLSVGIKIIKDKIQEIRNREKLELQTRFSKDETIEMQCLMDERKSLGNSNKTALEFASESEAVIANVRDMNFTLKKINDKTGFVSSTFQTAVSAMGLIKRQKVKHTIVLGLVAGFCMSFILWWWLRS